MAFRQITAPLEVQNDGVLSADNTIPQRHIVIQTLRIAAPRLGLTAPVISTLDAMLSCLAPKRNHHTVFASNATLSFRRNGISDRTIRRHAAILIGVGLLCRHDSPNKKRFTKHKSQEGKVLRFGFDLSPLYSKLEEIAELAASVQREHDQINYLRTKIRAVANQQLATTPDCPTANETLRSLRRKLTLTDCQDILTRLNAIPLPAEATEDHNLSNPNELSAKDGQIVRHHHKSTKEQIEKNQNLLDPNEHRTPTEPPLTVTEIISACPEALTFSLQRITTFEDIVAHSRTLAPMIGITDQIYKAAEHKIGPIKTAITVWAVLQFHEKIHVMGAYFRSITTGARSRDFSPEVLIRRLGKSNHSCVGS